MSPIRTAPAIVLLLVAVMLISGCTAPSSQGSSSNSGNAALQTYSDPNDLFTVKKPSSWTVTVGDDVQVKNTAAGGARVVFRPLFLSGSYRSLTAPMIANYLVGLDSKQVAGFTVTSVRQTQDGSMIEIAATYGRSGIPMTGIYTVFVAAPYAMFTGYESSTATFATNEPVMRAIAASYTPRESAQTGVAQTTATSRLLPLRETQQSGGVTMRIPDGWGVQVFPNCAGLIANDPRNTRGVVFLNRLHTDPGTTLPADVTPEDYLTTYLSRDFTTVSDVRILSYETADLSALSSGASSVKAMRISFSNSGTPSTGSFTVGILQMGGGYYSTVAYLWGIYAPTSDWALDAPVLLDSFSSIDYSQATIGGCKQIQAASWGAGSRSSGSGGSTGEDTREQQLKEWYAKQEKEDIFMEKFGDYTLNRDRVYNPETDQVYSVDQNFYQYYDTHREQYRQQNLQQLTDAQFRSLVPLDGNLHIQPNT
jgi:hypothetical protein